jgi:3'-phosphoadenosine 5'-phosphosulfate sulfotransferase (PAPS reductase)/FAD synthetase
LSINQKIDCVVPLSGGKDSQACLMLALQKFSAENIIALFCDTGFEHPETYAHVAKTAKENNIKNQNIHDNIKFFITYVFE